MESELPYAKVLVFAPIFVRLVQFLLKIDFYDSFLYHRPKLRMNSAASVFFLYKCAPKPIHSRYNLALQKNKKCRNTLEIY